MKKEITQELIRELLHYDPETGIFIWRKRDERWFKSRTSWKTWNTRFAEKKAGTIHKNRLGYRHINILVFGSPIKAHRLAWLYMCGEYLPREIDHISGDATDNRWLNLRDGADGINVKNKSLSRINTSGSTGVVWRERRKKWEAFYTVNNKQIYIGMYKRKEDAVKAAILARESLGYDPRHGSARTY